MFGTSGIRGPVGEEVTAELALSVGRAVGDELADRVGAGRTGAADGSSGRPRVVVGRDTRDSGRMLVDALAAGLRETGADVLDLAVAATPTVARAVGWKDADAGVSVTASHNPAPDNGIKLWQPSGQAYDAALRERVADRVRADDVALRGWDGLGDRRSTDARERHVETLVSAVDVDPLDVVVDVGNGAGGVTVDALGDLGCSVVTLNAQPDGSFPGRPSEPTAEHCTALAALVRETDAGLGIAHDGDADRMRAVADDGTFLSGDVTLALFAADAATEGDRVAVPVDTSLAVEDYLAERGVDVERTPVGDVYVAAAAADEGVAFGGEPSGAWIWPGETLCPDGPMAACRLADLASERPLGERVADVPEYPIRRDSIEVDDKACVMDRVREAILAADDEVDTLDGVRVDAGDGWYLVRASGTQPLVRITAEARDAGRADELFEEARDAVEDAR
jgi:phosphoglucosamine mutase